VRHPTLFAALGLATSQLMGQLHRSHHGIKFLKFLWTSRVKRVDKLDIHLVMGNYGMHKTHAVHAQFARQPRFYFHFPSTSALQLSLPNAVFRSHSIRSSVDCTAVRPA
jgi:hypothetical protein